MHPFSTPWKQQKTVKFSNVFRGYKKGALGTNGLNKLIVHCWSNLLTFHKTQIKSLVEIFNLLHENNYILGFTFLGGSGGGAAACGLAFIACISKK